MHTSIVHFRVATRRVVGLVPVTVLSFVESSIKPERRTSHYSVVESGRPRAALHRRCRADPSTHRKFPEFTEAEQRILFKVIVVPVRKGPPPSVSESKDDSRRGNPVLRAGRLIGVRVADCP